MENKFEVLSDKKLIIGRLIGEFGVENLDSMGIKYRQMAYDLNYSLICDVTLSKINISLIDALRVIKKYDKSKNSHLKKVPVAIVAQGSMFVFFKVIEQFISNANGDLKVFKDLTIAINWFVTQEAK